jgi:hypothetical protein
MQLVCIVIPNVVLGNFQTFHQCNALIEHFSAVIFVGIIYAGCDQIKVL